LAQGARFVWPWGRDGYAFAAVTRAALKAARPSAATRRARRRLWRTACPACLTDDYARRPVSRVLSLPLRGMDGHSSGTWLAPRLARPTRAGGGNAAVVTHVRPYPVLLPVGFALPPLLPAARCALAAPFHPCRQGLLRAGGLFSVALIPGVAPAGRYPAPCSRGARTFLTRLAASAAVQPPGPPDVTDRRQQIKRRSCPRPARRRAPPPSASAHRQHRPPGAAPSAAGTR
jgi:hypothetical protein